MALYAFYLLCRVVNPNEYACGVAFYVFYLLCRVANPNEYACGVAFYVFSNAFIFPIILDLDLCIF